ncbi:uncharacterized protein BT62DRAFT_1075233 [Guyanagaster necrorhizus]|uniref:Uncharacterized protein n=1 Tax=Guyanagaster necrorhizus TaxID=856835 RepID=A0A9P7VVC1_9AGAR|nr:uncharacterized protein BT62DRAFT_1075233 [Guyanagaster necrorhizus MCA 3950]KAG7447135.1 hypothetical protein BT62DRAFT_1075233 [Guyanagaster necrorhizus MCA 3950]
MVFCCEVMTSSIKADDARGIPTNAVEQAMPVRFGGASKVYVCLDIIIKRLGAVQGPDIQSTMAYLFNRTMRSKICCLDSYCLGGKSVDHSFKMSYAVGANELTRHLGPEFKGAELPSSFFPNVPRVQRFLKPAGSSPKLLVEVRAQNYRGDHVLNYQLPVLVSCDSPYSNIAYGWLGLSGCPTCASALFIPLSSNVLHESRNIPSTKAACPYPVYAPPIFASRWVKVAVDRIVRFTQRIRFHVGKNTVAYTCTTQPQFKVLFHEFHVLVPLPAGYQYASLSDLGEFITGLSRYVVNVRDHRKGRLVDVPQLDGDVERSVLENR